MILSLFARLSSLAWWHNEYLPSMLLALAVSCLYFIQHPTNPSNKSTQPGKVLLGPVFSIRSRLMYYFDCQKMFQEAYDKYNKLGKSTWIPSMGTRNDVVLTPKHLPWFLQQPDEILAMSEAYVKVNCLESIIGDDKYIADPWQGLLVKTELNRALDTTVLEMNNELQYAFEAQFGRDTVKWAELDLQETIRLVVAQAASRFTVGLGLCRDQDYIKEVLAIIDGMVLNAAIVGSCPDFLKRIVGFFVAFGTRRRIARFIVKLEPLFWERFEFLKYHKDNKDHPQEPQDFFQMMMRYAQKHRPDELDADTMIRRLCMANFGAIHQTYFAITNMIINIVSSDKEFDTISVLRNEVASVLDVDGANDRGQKWDKAQIAKLHKADSVAKETLRLNAFANRALFRRVQVDGLQTPDGFALPKGTIVTVLSHPPNVDPANFEDPLHFDPWRFSRMRDAGQDPATCSLVSTATQLVFGRGKHACPGRFLIDFELKMIIAYVWNNYDIKLTDEFTGKKLACRWITEAMFPPSGVKVLIKRREEEP